MPRETKFTKARQKKYLKLLSEGGRRHQSARDVGVSPRTVERFTNDSEEFAEAMAEAEMAACEVIEDVLFGKAKAGNDRSIEMYLYNRAPYKWRDQKNLRAELSGLNEEPIRHENVSLNKIANRILEDPVATKAANELLYRFAGEDAVDPEDSEKDPQGADQPSASGD